MSRFTLKLPTDESERRYPDGRPMFTHAELPVLTLAEQADRCERIYAASARGFAAAAAAVPRLSEAELIVRLRAAVRAGIRGNAAPPGLRRVLPGDPTNTGGEGAQCLQPQPSHRGL